MRLRNVVPLLLSVPLLLAASVSDFGWMAGSWREIKGQGWTEEVWMAPKAGIMLGMSRTGQRGNAETFEFLRIEGDTIVTLYASPEGKPATAFKLAKSGPKEIIFENAENDFPQRIRYAREGEMLVASISMLDGSKAVSWRYKRTK
jgi:hypothetical protein